MGFHSMIEVLLAGGALQEPAVGYDSPISRALHMRRLDIIELLVTHGCDPCSIDMTGVLRSWDPKIFEFFIARGADVVTGQPFAHAFCERIRTALKPFKELCTTRPELKEQANVAMRHHCKEGDIKWVSLLLWAGADPLKPGADEPGRDCDEEGSYSGLSALGYAALYEHYEIFKLKPIRTLVSETREADFIRYLHKGEGVDILRRMLERGWSPNDQGNGGCSMIPELLNRLTWPGRFSSRFDVWLAASGRRKFDSTESRDTMKVVHVLAKHGARWVPKDKHAISYARRSLLQMTPDYTVEFVWIMAKYRACELPPLKELLGTPTMKANTGAHWERLTALLATWS
jgi:hypothetical protein